MGSLNENLFITAQFVLLQEFFSGKHIDTDILLWGNVNPIRYVHLSIIIVISERTK